MQDVTLGYPELDRNVIVKTNNPEKLKAIFASQESREIFQTLSGYSLKLDNHDDREDHYLNLHIQRAITNLNELQRILAVFYHILVSFDKDHPATETLETIS